MPGLALILFTGRVSYEMLNLKLGFKTKYIKLRREGH